MNSNEFNIFSWSGGIPLCDDLWLGMQARNIAMVDISVIRPIEGQALTAYMERERTPVDILLPLSALSQMLVFSLYEFLRTWRQRAKEIIRIAERYQSLPEGERDAFLAKSVSDAEAKENMVKIAPTFYSEHIAKVSDTRFVDGLKSYFELSEGLFRDAEALRVNLAKHEVPKTPGIIAEAPGYGRMSYRDGAIYWFLTLKDGSLLQVNRRELANVFLGIDDDEI